MYCMFISHWSSLSLFVIDCMCVANMATIITLLTMRVSIHVWYVGVCLCSSHVYTQWCT